MLSFVIPLNIWKTEWIQLLPVSMTFGRDLALFQMAFQTGGGKNACMFGGGVCLTSLHQGHRESLLSNDAMQDSLQSAFGGFPIKLMFCVSTTDKLVRGGSCHQVCQQTRSLGVGAGVSVASFKTPHPEAQGFGGDRTWEDHLFPQESDFAAALSCLLHSCHPSCVIRYQGRKKMCFQKVRLLQLQM